MGLLVCWVDRKLTARVQWRVGPPWYQNFIDILKLALYKETLIPEGVSKVVFLGMPILAVSSATLVSTIILTVNGMPGRGFIGDLIVVVYLLMIPSIALMLGGFASANPLASLGASREMKLMLSYELPFILSLIAPIIKSGYAIKLGDIIMCQYNNGPIIASLSGAISFIVMLLCVQAKLGLTPFDMPEAETEIMSGLYIEYSGKALAIFKIAKAILGFALPVFLIIIYFGGIRFTINGFVKNVLQYILILFLMVVIKNTNPRVRIDQAVRFFWTTVTMLAVLSAGLAYMGY
jgi:NADH-quinone oxidoreductase subunit H